MANETLQMRSKCSSLRHLYRRAPWKLKVESRLFSHFWSCTTYSAWPISLTELNLHCMSKRW